MSTSTEITNGAQKLVKLDRSKKAQSVGKVEDRMAKKEEALDDARAAAELFAKDKAYRHAFRARLETLYNEAQNQILELQEALGIAAQMAPERPVRAARTAPEASDGASPAKPGRKPSSATEGLRDAVLAAIKRAGKTGVSAGEIKAAIGDDSANISVLLKGTSGWHTTGQKRSTRYFWG